MCNRSDRSSRVSANRHLNDVSHGIGGRQMTLRFEPILVLNSDPIVIVQIRTGLDHSVGFNERVTAFTTGTACTPSSDIKGRICPMYTSDIENRQHRSLLEHRRRQITDVDVVKKIGFANPATGGGGGALRRPQDDSGERPPMESYTLGPRRSRRLAPSWAAGSPRPGTRLSRRRGVVAVGCLVR